MAKKTFPSFLLGGVLLAIILFLFFNRQSFVSFIFASRNFFLSFFDRSFDYQIFKELILENQSLKTELAKLKKSETSPKNSYQIAEIFFNYPFSDNSFLVLNQGRTAGLKEGVPIFAADNVLLGRIKEVKNNLSRAETIFSTDWKESVIIGDKKIKAVLNGNSQPYLDLISQDSGVKTGDPVFNISPNLPYGVLIGFVDEIRTSASDPWLKASLKIPYDLNHLTQVLIKTDYETFK